MSLTRSSEQGGGSGLTSRPVAWFAILITGLIAGTGLYVGLTRPENRTFNLALAAMIGSVSVMMLVGMLPKRLGWRRAELEGRPAWALAVGGPSAGATAAMALIGTVWALGIGLAAFTVDSVPLAVILGVVALFMLVLGLEGWRLLLRRPELRVSADKIQFRGPGIDSELAWDDVGVVVYEGLGTRWAAVHVTAVRDAASYRAELSRLVLPTDRLPEPPGIAVRVGLVQDSAALLKLLRAMQTGERSGREAMISRGLPADSGY